MANLDNTLEALREGNRTLTREEFEQSILTNQPEFAHYAKLFMDERADGMLRSFLGWSWARYQDEHTPAYKNGWAKK